MVKIEGRATTISDLQPPRVRVEIWSDGVLISQPLSAHHGYEEATGDIQLRMSEKDPMSIDSNSVTLLIPPGANLGETASINLLDATTGVRLSRLENIPIHIAF